MSVQSAAKPLPFFYVGKALTDQRKKDYSTQKNNLLSQAIGKPDTQSIWYSKHHLAKLLQEIELAGGDGLRIHLGMYEPSHEFAGQTCLMMNVTRLVQEGGFYFHKDVILEEEADFGDRSSAEREIKLIQGYEQEEGRSRDFNYGSPCPPRCSGGPVTG